MAEPEPVLATHEELAFRLVDGDESVVPELIQAFSPKLLWILRDKFGDLLTDEERHDAMTTALLKAWKYRERYDESRGTLAGWLVTIAFNSAKDLLKGRRSVDAASLEDPGEVIDEFDDEPLSAERLAIIDEVEAFVAGLPPKQQEIARADLATPGGTADSAPLAKRLDTTQNAVRVQRNLYRKKFRGHFSSRGYE